jgi:uncharacterized protein YndB with AHSA1/START domain
MSEGIVAEKSAGVHELTIERRFAAPPQKVFAAWTDPALLAGWFGPGEMTCPEVELDVREGGRWRTVMLETGGTRHIVAGTYVEIDPPRRLVMTWAWEQGGAFGNETLVEIDLEADGDGTLMHFRHSGFETVGAVEMHSHGWGATWPCLDAFIAEGKLG